MDSTAKIDLLTSICNTLQKAGDAYNQREMLYNITEEILDRLLYEKLINISEYDTLFEAYL